MSLANHAVVVLYHPDHVMLGRQFAALIGQVTHIIYVSNGCAADRLEWLRSQADESRLSVLENSGNLGLAAAQNAGVARAINLGADNILLLDQDSIPALNMVDCLQSALQCLQAQSVPVGALGPRVEDVRTGRSWPFVRYRGAWRQRQQCGEAGGEGVLEADFLIASGSFIPVSVWRDVGGGDESLFIDHVDTDWCLRVRQRGYRLFGVCLAVMRHELGDQVRQVAGGQRQVAIYRPVRLFYIFRNSLLLWRRPWASGAWVLADAFRLAQIAVLMLVTGTPRRVLLLAMWLGLRAGYQQRTGSIDDQLAATLCTVSGTAGRNKPGA